MNSEDFKKQLIPVSQQLFRLCYRFLGSVTEAEDAVQEVYLKLWSMRDKLTGIINLEAFSITVTKNYCLDRIKSRKTKPIDVSMAYGIAADQSQSPYNRLENRDSEIFIKQIIDTLPDQQKTVIILKDIEDYSFEQIQKITGLDINNIRVNLSRARKQVRNEIIKFHNYGTERNKVFTGKIL